MISTKAIWICPKLCGCELEIDADWNREPIQENGRVVSYQHPIPFTIRGIEIVNACIEHDSFRTDPLPTDPYNGCVGYIKLPIENPNEAQKLYIQLYKYNGQRYKPDTCECVVYKCFDDFTKEEFVKTHDKHTRKCNDHANDNDHTKALDENKLKNNTLSILLQDNDLADDDFDPETGEVRGRKFKKGVYVNWAFDAKRDLSISLLGVNPVKKAGLQTALQTTLNSTSVKIL